VRACVRGAGQTVRTGTYDDLFTEPDASLWASVKAGFVEHMEVVDSWPAQRGFLLMAVGAVVVAVGPLFIDPTIDGLNYGLVFSWGVIVFNVRTGTETEGECE
jgi:hypothetical protein